MKGGNNDKVGEYHYERNINPQIFMETQKEEDSSDSLYQIKNFTVIKILDNFNAQLSDEIATNASTLRFHTNISYLCGKKLYFRYHFLLEYASRNMFCSCVSFFFSLLLVIFWFAASSALLRTFYEFAWMYTFPSQSFLRVVLGQAQRWIFCRVPLYLILLLLLQFCCQFGYL